MSVCSFFPDGLRKTNRLSAIIANPRHVRAVFAILSVPCLKTGSLQLRSVAVRVYGDRLAMNTLAIKLTGQLNSVDSVPMNKALGTKADNNL